MTPKQIETSRAALERIRASTATFLLPEELAPVLGCEPYSITRQAQEDPEKLGFPVIVTGTRARIPREGFLSYMKYGRLVMPGQK